MANPMAASPLSLLLALPEALLSWWRHNHPQIPTWAKAARMIFSMQCSSAASEV